MTPFLILRGMAKAPRTALIGNTSTEKDRIANEHALALIGTKSTEKDRIANELCEQHSKLLGLWEEISQLEERNQPLENAAASRRFKAQSLQQEMELLKRNNKWHTNELQNG